MKHKLFTLLFAVVASVGTMFAESGTCGENVTWDLTDGVLTISGTGEMVNFSPYSSVPWYPYRSAIQSVVIGNGVTSIGDNAFIFCKSMTSVTIPNSVTSIGSWAFQGCSNLASVIIPNNVTNIGGVAFCECSSLTSIEIPNSVTKIGDYPFTNCTSLTSINVENGNPNYISQDGVLFNKGKTKLIQYPCGKQGNSYTIPNSVTSIEIYAFGYCAGLTSVTIPNSVTSVKYRAFYQCNNLTSIIIPNSVTYIADAAFEFCTGLTSITVAQDNLQYCSVDGVLFDKDKTILLQYPARKTRTSYVIPNTVTSIGSSAFYDCTSLTSVTIPNSVSVIGSCAFSRCSGLTSVTIPNSVTSIELSAFQKCTGLTSIEIPNSVTSLENAAFSMCSGLRSVTLGNGITNIGYEVFYACSNLDSIIIPNSVVSIEREAFAYCAGLTSVTIPNSVTSIENSAFRDCTGLTSVTNYATIPQTINATVFSSVKMSACTLQVPAQSVNAYKAATIWKDFGSIKSIGGETPCTPISGTCGAKLTWELSCDSVLTISGTGAMTDYTNISANPWYAHRNAIKSIIIGNRVTSIGLGAFYECYNLTSIEIPNNVTSIGDGAFEGCSGLTSVTIGSGVTSIGKNAFRKCTSLSSVEIPNSVTSMGTYVFEYCTSLTSATIGNSVTGIGYGAFGNCTGLTSATIGKGVTSIENFAFYNCSSLTSVTNYAITPQTITEYVFGEVNISACTLYVPAQRVNTYKAATIWKDFGAIQAIGGETPCTPVSGTCGTNLTWELSCDSVLTISGTGVMTDFTNTADIPWYAYHDVIKSIIIGNGVKSIGNYAFFGCTRSTSVTIPNTVTSIGQAAFGYCTGLISVTIPNSVMSIEQGAFGGCTGLLSVTIGNGVTSIGQVAFYECTALTSVTIPNSVTSIGMGAFSHCSSLGSVTISNSVTSIERETFEYCSSLTSVTIPNSVTSIGDWAFENCTGLTSVTIPNSVTSIGDEAFSECSALTSVTNYATTPQTIDEYVFYNINLSACTLYVPAESVNAYKAATIWKNFGSIKGKSAITYFRVTFLDWDDTVLKTEQVEEGHAATAPAYPTREGYTFIGWDRDFSYVMSDLIVRAQYRKNNVTYYTVTFLDWDGTELYVEKVAEGENAVGPAVLPTREGYTFIGWSKPITNIRSNLIVLALYEKLEGIEDLPIDSDKATKLLRDGQIFIPRGDKVYTIQGQKVR